MSTDVSEVHAASVIRAIKLMMEAARTSVTSVDIQLRTLQYIPEDSELHIRRHEISQFDRCLGPMAIIKIMLCVRRRYVRGVIAAFAFYCSCLLPNILGIKYSKQ
jgi:hypothetical protein